MLFQKRDRGLSLRRIAGSHCRVVRLSDVARIALNPPLPLRQFVSQFAVLTFIAMIFSKVAHGLLKNLCADARSLAGDYGKRKAEQTFIFGLTLSLLPCSQAVRRGVDRARDAGPFLLLR